MMMEELPEAQGALIHIRDEMLAAPDTPTSTSRSGPAMVISPGYSAQRAAKRKRVSPGVQNRIAKAARLAHCRHTEAEWRETGNGDGISSISLP